MQRDLVRELAQLVRYAEPDGTNIGAFVAGHASELAHFLELDERELHAAVHERDGALVDRLRVRLELAVERELRLRRDHCAERAQRAARELGATARWFEIGVVLDVDIVLGDLLADSKVRFVSFTFADAKVIVPSVLLRRVRALWRVYIDLACFVDERGVHFRWKGGRGQLNFHGHARPDREVLVVHLPRRVEHQAMLAGEVTDVGYGA